MHRVTIIIEPTGSVRVLTDSAEVQVLVVDRTTRSGSAVFSLADEPASVQAFLEGIPSFQPARVSVLYEEAGTKIPEIAALPGIGSRARAQLSNLTKLWFSTKP